VDNGGEEKEVILFRRREKAAAVFTRGEVHLFQADRGKGKRRTGVIRTLFEARLKTYKYYRVNDRKRRGSAFVKGKGGPRSTGKEEGGLRLSSSKVPRRGEKKGLLNAHGGLGRGRRGDKRESHEEKGKSYILAKKRRSSTGLTGGATFSRPIIGGN